MSATNEKTAVLRPADLGPMPVWDLSDLYPGPQSAEVEADLEKAVAEAKRIKEACEGRLAALAREGEPFGEAIAAYERLSETLGRLGSYAGLLYAADRADPEHARFYGNIQERLNAISTQVLFFELEINRMDDAELAEALKAPSVSRYKPWLEDLRKEKPYQLEERLERLFHESALTSRAAWNRLFDETIAALRFDVRGEPAPLPIEPTLKLLFDTDGARRQAAAEALASVFKDNIRLFTLVTNTLAKDKEIFDRWHGFQDVADSRHLSNRVERPVVEAMVSAVREAYPATAHRYYALKAKWLGKPRLPYWDRNAPLPDQPERIVTWADARATVLDAYGAFEPRLAKVAERFFESGWIDAPVREGKSPGAFSHPTVPSVHPYILLNYQGKPRDVMTLAHELGHGVHQSLAAPLGPLLAQTPLTLAETASVFGEMLTFKALLNSATDAREHKALLAQKAEDMINTVVRQIAFYTFERRLHEERRSGELTAERIGEIWMEAQAESLGPAVDLSEGYETWWCYVPHFVHAPFYVYAYAFGDCLVNSLYGLYQDAHPGFVAKYVAMLEAGGSKHHSELLKPFGLDATQRAFWQKGLKVLEGMIDELERM